MVWGADATCNRANLRAYLAYLAAGSVQGAELSEPGGGGVYRLVALGEAEPEHGTRIAVVHER